MQYGSHEAHISQIPTMLGTPEVGKTPTYSSTHLLTHICITTLVNLISQTI